NKTKKNIDKVLETQNKKLEISLEENKNKISKFISTIVNELTFITFIMIILVILLAIWMSNYITSKTQKLIKGTQHFSKNDLDYKIEVTSNDEIGKLETAFNEMAQKLKKEIQTNKTKDTILIQKNKMAEMGDMMASILHQWKQPLNAIHMTTSSIKLFTEINQPLSDEKLKEKLEQIDKQIYLMNDTMDDFRDFFRPTQKQWYKISSTVKKVIALIDGLYTPKGIKVLFHINSDSMLNGYPNEMMQVIINLINNSRDAILENQSSIKDIHINVDKQENFTIISISDLAGGIPKEYFENIFKPYFTSKSKDKGTGIGLHLSKLIIEKVKGSIKVENHTQVIDDKEYKGARFIIKVPCE
ncbi:MAG: HAMP domain-containing sensor histidine kinase, partial [Sphaerochaetaceae bacterium]|nr:HAMP domain-containing sensor histidine kinase [Sphaerochaetaceae bacterium]